MLQTAAPLPVTTSPHLLHQMWPLYSFHAGTSRQEDEIYRYARARDAAINTLGGFKSSKAIFPGLASKLVASPTGQTLSSDNAPSDFSHLITNLVTDASWEKDFLHSDGRLKLAHQIYVATNIVEKSNLSPFLCLDSRSLDILSGQNLNFKPLRPKSFMADYEQKL